MPDAAYYRAWRAAHPEYRERQRLVRRARRARMTPEERRHDRGPGKPAVQLEPIPPVWPCGQHSLIDLAWGYVSHRPRGESLSFFQDELAVDAVGEAVLAMLEHRDPVEAVRMFYTVEKAWSWSALPFLLDGDLDDEP